MFDCFSKRFPIKEVKMKLRRQIKKYADDSAIHLKIDLITISLNGDHAPAWELKFKTKNSSDIFRVKH